MDEDETPQPNSFRWSPAVLSVCVVAGAIALIMYVSASNNTAVPGVIAISFLCLLPAAISYVLASVSGGGRPYLIPVWIALVAIVIGAAFLREGVICILMLTPLWLISGWVGVWLARRRTRYDAGGIYSHAILLLPLLAAQIEPSIPIPETNYSVTRSIIVSAKPPAIWPSLKGIPDVRPNEGRWNITQDVIGVPRPHGAWLTGRGLGADRHANWDRNIRFRERITDWRPGAAIGWRFIFDDMRGWAYTDRHLMPDSPYFRVTSGGYALTPLSDGRTRVSITTQYRIKTPLNEYARLWGELLLGDLENNLLALVKERSEAGWTGAKPT